MVNKDKRIILVLGILLFLFLGSFSFYYYFYKSKVSTTSTISKGTKDEISPFGDFIGNESTLENGQNVTINYDQPFGQALWGKFLSNLKNSRPLEDIDLDEGQVLGLIENKEENVYNILVLKSYDTTHFAINELTKIEHCNENNTWIGNSYKISKLDYTLEMSTADKYYLSVFCRDYNCNKFLDECFIFINE